MDKYQRLPRISEGRGVLLGVSPLLQHAEQAAVVQETFQLLCNGITGSTAAPHRCSETVNEGGHLTCCAVLCCAVQCYAVLCYAMLCCAVLCYAMLCYAMLCYAMLCYAMLCCAILCYTVLWVCCAMPSCAVELYHANPCYAPLCCAMLCYNLLCYFILCCINQTQSRGQPSTRDIPKRCCDVQSGKIRHAVQAGVSNE